MVLADTERLQNVLIEMVSIWSGNDAKKKKKGRSKSRPTYVILTMKLNSRLPGITLHNLTYHNTTCHN